MCSNTWVKDGISSSLILQLEKVEVKPELCHVRDVYSFAVLADELLEKLSDLGE